MKLDKKAIARLALPTGKTDFIVFDELLPGFGLRLRGAGGQVRKSWVVQYRRAGRSRRLLLGSAEVLSAEQARAAAKKLSAQSPQVLIHKPTRRRAVIKISSPFAPWPTITLRRSSQQCARARSWKCNATCVGRTSKRCIPFRSIRSRAGTSPPDC